MEIQEQLQEIKMMMAVVYKNNFTKENNKIARVELKFNFAFNMLINYYKEL